MSIHNLSRFGHVAAGLSRCIRLLFAASLPLICSQAFGQQSYVGRYDVYAGYMYLNSPHISLGEPGFHLQAGFRPTAWYSLDSTTASVPGTRL